MTPTRTVSFLTLAFILSCAPAVKRGEAQAASPDPKKEPAALQFGWPVGASFSLVETSVRDGESLVIRTHGKVTARDATQLAVSFDAPVLEARDKELVAPGKSHAYQDLWPELVVDKKTGELAGFGAVIPDASHSTVAYRWRVWTTLVGFDVPLGQERSSEAEVEVGEGLIVPVHINEVHVKGASGGRRVKITRVYDGEPTKKLWIMMQADSGAKKADLASIKDARQEETVIIDFDPKTLAPTLADIESTFTVTTMVGKTEKTDVRSQKDTWAFAWSK